MKAVNSKSNGVHMWARQRVHRDRTIPVKAVRLSLAPSGHLLVAGSIGEERGLSVVAALSLEELLAWLPKMVENAKQHASHQTNPVSTLDDPHGG